MRRFVRRYLCLAGCNTEQKNGDGIKAEITALKHGYNNIGDLLGRLKNVSPSYKSTLAHLRLYKGRVSSRALKII